MNNKSPVRNPLQAPVRSAFVQRESSIPTPVAFTVVLTALSNASGSVTTSAYIN